MVWRCTRSNVQNDQHSIYPPFNEQIVHVCSTGFSRKTAQSRFEISSSCERQGASRRFVASRVPAASALPLTGLSSIGLMPELQTTSIPRFYCTNCVNATRVHIGFRLYRCFLASIFRKNRERVKRTTHQLAAFTGQTVGCHRMYVKIGSDQS